MKTDREKLIGVFAELGRRLDNFGMTGDSRKAITQAIAENGWFTPESIISAVGSIRQEMLAEFALRKWTAAYPVITVPKNIGVVMAGNIPLVGFFDILCVLASGHRLHFKASSKDRALTEYIISRLRSVDAELPVYELGSTMPDAVIATGSDNTNRYFRSLYSNIPAIFRGSRSSAAVLDGSETQAELEGLASDIFSYSGLGCRNVSHLILPPGYDFGRLKDTFDKWKPVNAKYMNNFRQRSAMLAVEGKAHDKGRFYVLREDDSFPSYISEITWHTPAGSDGADKWLLDNDRQIQCVVGRTGHPRGVEFGRSQSPSLTDYPDAVDTMNFLARI